MKKLLIQENSDHFSAVVSQISKPSHLKANQHKKIVHRVGHPEMAGRSFYKNCFTSNKISIASINYRQANGQ